MNYTSRHAVIRNVTLLMEEWQWTKRLIDKSQESLRGHSLSVSGRNFPEFALLIYVYVLTMGNFAGFN